MEQRHNKIVIYTANIGGYDYVREPAFLPPNCDFVCLTDRPLESKNWEIRQISIWNNDPVRTARRCKVLPHTFFPEYEYSIWVDANMTLRGDVNELINTYLNKVNLAVFSHSALPDFEDSVYHHAEVLRQGKDGKTKDDPALIEKQMEHYHSIGFPDDNGLISSMAMVRRHNESDVMQAMETWWKEISTYSRRDQLSFNYAVWKTKCSFVYMDGNSRDNKYFKHTTHKKATLGGKLKWFINKKIPLILGLRK